MESQARLARALPDGVDIRRRTKQRLPEREPVPPQAGKLVNEGWALDFVHDVLCDGRRFRTLKVIDGANREALAIEVGISIPAARLIRTLMRLIDWYGPPPSIRMDNGPEMRGHDLAEWASARGIALNYIQPGEPDQNAYIERFNCTYRHEVLDAHVFRTIKQVQRITEEWLLVYNEQRSHDALGGLLPKQFLPKIDHRRDLQESAVHLTGELTTTPPGVYLFACTGPLRRWRKFLYK